MECDGLPRIIGIVLVAPCAGLIMPWGTWPCTLILPYTGEPPISFMRRLCWKLLANEL